MNYCLFTKNACGTDTWPIGRPCTCSSCQQWLRSSMTFGLEQVVDSVLSEGTPTTATEVQTVVLKVAIAAFHLGFLRGTEKNNPSGTNTPSPDALY